MRKRAPDDRPLPAAVAGAATYSEAGRGTGRARLAPHLPFSNAYVSLILVGPLRQSRALVRNRDRRGALCAERSSAGSELTRALLLMQDSLQQLGVLTAASRLPQLDTATLARCTEEPEVIRDVRHSIEASRSLGVRGTPAIVFGGVAFESPPSGSELDRFLALVAPTPDVVRDIALDIDRARKSAARDAKRR